MKGKVEEIKQFKNFLARVEKGGYLDMMFGNLTFWVERQIADDFGVDVYEIIKGERVNSFDLKEANRKLREQAQLKEDIQDDAEKLRKEYTKVFNHAEVLQKRANESERLQLLVTHLREKICTLRQGCDQLGAQVNIDKNRLEQANKEISRLKGKLFDCFEEIQKLNKKRLDKHVLS